MASESVSEILNHNDNNDNNDNNNNTHADVVVNADKFRNNTAKEECVELRNIKYKSMLLKKSSPKQLTKYNSNNDSYFEF